MLADILAQHNGTDVLGWAGLIAGLWMLRPKTPKGTTK